MWNHGLDVRTKALIIGLLLGKSQCFIFGKGVMGVLRLSHLEVGVEDLELCTAYYVEVVGMIEVSREPIRTYLKCWDEEEHHSLILTQAPERSLIHVAFKVEREEDFEAFENTLEKRGCHVERIPEDKETGQGSAIRFKAPTGHQVELVHKMQKVGRPLPKTNPPPYPLGLIGIHPPRLNRAYLTADSITEAEDFFTRTLGFRTSEQVVADGGGLLAAWMERSHTPCDLAVVPGPSGGLHHLSFEVEDRAEVFRAADVLACNGIHIEAGPARSGATRSQGVHFLDPAGNGNEVFAGGYRTDPDFETVTWTEEEMGRAFFYSQPNMYAGFLKAQKV